MFETIAYIATKEYDDVLDCQLVQVLMFCSCSFPLSEYELVAEGLFEFISISVTE